MTTAIENIKGALSAAQGRSKRGAQAGWTDYRRIVAALAAGETLDAQQTESLANCIETMRVTDGILADDVREWLRRPAVVASAKAAAEKCGPIEAEAARIEAEREAFYSEHGDTVRRAAELDFAHQQAQQAVPKVRDRARQTRLALEAHTRDYSRLFGELTDGAE